MTKVPNYSQIYTDNFIKFMSKKYSININNYLKSFEEDTTDTRLDLVNVLSKKSEFKNNQDLVIIDQALNYTSYFKSCKTFSIKDLDTVPSYLKRDLLDLMPEADLNEIVVNFSKGDVSGFVYLLKRTIPLLIKGKNCSYTLTVFADMYKYKESHSVTEEPVMYFLQVCKIHVTDDGGIYIELPCNNHTVLNAVGFSNISYLNVCEDTPVTIPTCTISQLNVLLDVIGLPRTRELFCVCNHTLYCYAHRSKLLRKSSKTHREYSKAEVHISSSKDDVKYVPLRDYVYSKTYESRGGHHASPVAHERKGFFRKSRGRGDYNLINGEYVYVGRLLGKYSYVEATKVNSKKGTKIIYTI